MITWIVVGVMWVLLAVVAGLWIAQVVRRRDEQKPEDKQ